MIHFLFLHTIYFIVCILFVLFLVLTDDDLPYIPGEEEPYSPVDEDVPSLSDDINTASSIEQQMEELTRKIEKEKLVIQMMTAGSQNSILIDDNVCIL